MLLLNTVLTVRAHQANSHRGIGWEEFTDAAIRVLNEQDRPIVFYALGQTGTDEESHAEQSQASDTGSASSQPFVGFSGDFSAADISVKANAFLTEHGLEPIDWQIEKQTGETSLYGKEK